MQNKFSLKNLILLSLFFILYGCGAGVDSSLTSSTTTTNKAPSSPAGVSATGGDSQATISWNSVSGASSYNIYYATTTGVTKSSGTKISSATSPYTHSSLTNDTTYYYVVTAVNGTGESSESSEVSAKPSATGTAPSAPTGVSATAGDGQATISWSSVTGATNYNIYWSTTTGVKTNTGTKISSATSPYTHSSLTNDTTYYYVVTAVNSSGESSESSEVSAAPVSAVVSDTTPPTVSSTSPSNSATGVALNSTITATFSEAMDSSTVTTSTFTLKDSSNNAVTGNVSYSGTTATWTPSSSLSNSTTYTATITTGVKDSAGNVMASNYTWSFTTTSSYSVKQITSTSITTNTTWNSGTVYVINNDLSIKAALTIEPNTIIKLKSGVRITVTSTGVISADATSASPIIFTSYKDDSFGGDTNGDATITSPAVGDWDSIYLQSSDSKFNYCKFYYGGGSSYKYTINLTGKKTTITNSTFAHNDGGTLSAINGVINASGAPDGTVITGNTFYDNKLPLYVSGNFSIDNSNVFHNPSDTSQKNTYNGIFKDSNSLTGIVTWSETEVPFVITDWFYVKTGASLTLGDNSIIKFMAGEHITVESGGTIIANATTGNKIVFTSIKDDSNGGDTNGDGSTTSPASGDWGYIYISGDGAKFNYCEFYYGGGYSSSYTWTLKIYNASATITNSTFAHNDGGTLSDISGVIDAHTASAGTIITGNVFYDNKIPLYINGNGTFAVDDSNVFHNPTDTSQKNTYNGIFVNDGKITSSITWSETEVPFVITDNQYSIGTGGSLTLGDNVVIKSVAGSYITSESGSGNIVNYSGTGVYFTSIKDDTLKGDTNGDGSITSPETGDWKGIQLNIGGSWNWQTWSNILYDSH